MLTTFGMAMVLPAGRVSFSFLSLDRLSRGKGDSASREIWCRFDEGRYSWKSVTRIVAQVPLSCRRIALIISKLRIILSLHVSLRYMPC